MTPIDIDFDEKRPDLVKVFRHFHNWLLSQGFQAVCASGGESGIPHTYTYPITDDLSLCSLQFCGKDNNEYVRFRFYKAQLQSCGIHPAVSELFSRSQTPAVAKYDGELPTEEHLDFYRYGETVCHAVCDGLAHIFQTHSIPRRGENGVSS